MAGGGFPVFVVGAPRSGTTLVYSILTTASEFPHFESESRIMECSTKYGRLSRPKNMLAFLEDFIDSRQFARSGLDPDTFSEAAAAQCRHYTEFLAFFMQNIAIRQGKSRWAEKTPNHVFYMRGLARAFPSARFIHVIRDGRDVAASQRRLGFFRGRTENALRELVLCAKDWEAMVRYGRRLGATLRGRYMELRYEDVIRKLPDVLGRMERFTNVDLPQRQIYDSEIGSLRKGNTAYPDRMTGVSTAGLSRWTTVLSEEEKAALGVAIGRTLTAFGYPVGTTPPDMIKRIRFRVMAGVGITGITVKRFLNRHTPFGRFARKPLEIGLK